MSLLIAFADPVGPTEGAANDGVIYGVLSAVPAVTALSDIHAATFTKIYRGNSDVLGNVTYTNVTDAANNDTAGDVVLFDTVNPTVDRLCIEVGSTDRIKAIALLIATAGVVTGSPVANVSYKRASDGAWVSVANIVTPLLTAIGTATITFDALDCSAIAPTDDLLNPQGNPAHRCIYLSFTGMTAVTTAPAFTRIWKILEHAGHLPANFTALISQTGTPDFSGAQASILPMSGDLSLFGWDEKPVRMLVTTYRPSGVVVGDKEWVYGKSDGSFAAMPAANLNDPTLELTAVPAATGTPTLDVAAIPGVTEWYRPDGLAAGALASWVDSAGAANNLTAVGAPTVVVNAYNGHPTVRFDGAADYFDLVTPRADVRTMFIVFKEDAAAVNNTTFIWGHATSFHYHRGPTKQILSTGNPPASVLNGSWRINGSVVAPTTTVYPTSLSIMSAEVTANTDVGKLGRDRTIASRFFDGDVCEWIILDSTITEALRLQIEGYLAHKYGIQSSLPAGHTHRYIAPGMAVAPVAISIAPPADWAKSTIVDSANASHPRYWIGLRMTASPAAPSSPANFLLSGQPVAGGGIEGFSAPETKTYTQASIIARRTSAVAETLVLVNGTTGATVAVTIEANASIQNSVISFAVARGDEILLFHALGAPVATLADGMILLS